ncbi:glycosyltransferase family 4 protein [Planktotalea sp.]|uniref:glycosyltransferase family 4 protein n=1 Tax=Planktotalea sp. TaxID=2029877 RepID=UPI0032985E01
MKKFIQDYLGFLIPPLVATKKAYYNTAKLFVHQLFRSVFENDIVAWKPDVVHTHDGMSLPLGVAAAKRSDAFMVFDSHELEAHRNPPLSPRQRRNVEKIEQRYLPQADAVTTVGQKIADHLVAEYGIERPRVIYNAPPQTSRPLPEKWQQPARGSLRAEANIPDDAIVLVYTGNITMNRGVEQTLEGMAAYLKRPGANPNVRLSMVGKTRPEIFDAVTQLAAKLNLQDHIHFHDPVSPTAVVEFIAEGDIAVIPVIPVALSYDYAMPNKLFESMLAGLPILGARLAEMGPFIEEHQLGVCYDPVSAPAFADALATLLSNGAAPRLNETRIAELAKQFSWEAQEAVLRDVYAGLDATGNPLRVAMVVPNPCNPDYRVVKQAETLAAAGHEVCIFCTRPVGSDLPDLETINAVDYRRLDWSVRSAADGFLKFYLRRLLAK